MAVAQDSITLRDATPADEPFLFQVYACTRAEELALAPWTDEQRNAFLAFQFRAQHTYYHDQFRDATFQIIVANGTDVGRLYVSRKPSEVKIIDITVLPEHRNRGIGSLLIKEVLAAAERRPVSIWIEHFNPSQNLFRRLGFTEIAEDGYNRLWQWQPS